MIFEAHELGADLFPVQRKSEIGHDSPIMAENAKLARQINREARSNPKSPYVGKFVGIANGKVVVVADNWSAVTKRLQEVEPDPRKCYGVDASADYDREVYIY